MPKSDKKSKMTLEKLAVTTQHEFLSVGKKVDYIQENMATKDDLKDIQRENLRIFATKDDLRHFATKDDLRHFATKDDLKTTEVKILQAVDKVMTKFDRSEKEDAAHTQLHKRITDEFHGHSQRLKKLEAGV